VEWTEHFQYLLQFFRHEQYLKVDGRPVFFIYRIGHNNLPFILGMMMIVMMGWMVMMMDRDDDVL
jgi:hypothetical protein